MGSSDPAFFSDKYWIKRARISAGDVGAVLVDPAGDGSVSGATGGLWSIRDDGTTLADLRIEGGRVRAVLPAGAAPCCCRGIDAGGGAVVPRAGAGRIAVGNPADLVVETVGGCRITLDGGRPCAGDAVAPSCVPGGRQPAGA